ncbi:glycosyltransferase [Avibacterium avium]|uniref:glycosyltransferase n=1 Tax=Avibacterium avium TaxID=751 RepID=UPI003BF8CF8E
MKYLRKYDKVVSICDEMATQIKDKANLSNEKLFTLYNPINFDIVVKKSLLEEIENDPPYFIQVARLDKIKRHCDLIEIYSRLVNLGVKENLYIVGNGEEYHNLKTQIEKLHLQDRCFLLGEIKNPYPYMKNAKLFLHTSEREGLPTVLLESLVLGIPVIAMNCKTGVQEILNYGKCGRIVEFGNKEKFIEDCLLLESDDLINSYKEEIPKHLSLFSEQSIKSSLIKLLESLSGELR